MARVNSNILNTTIRFIIKVVEKTRLQRNIFTFTKDIIFHGNTKVEEFLYFYLQIPFQN